MTNKQRREKLKQEHLDNSISKAFQKMREFDYHIEESVEYNYELHPELGLVISDSEENLYEPN